MDLELSVMLNLRYTLLLLFKVKRYIRVYMYIQVGSEYTTCTFWIRVLKQLCKYPANIPLDQGLKVLVPPPQN